MSRKKQKEKQYKIRIGPWAIAQAMRGITQGQLGKRLGEPRPKLNQIIKGHRTAGEKLAKKWAKDMGIGLDELFEPVGDKS